MSRVALLLFASLLAVSCAARRVASLSQQDSVRIEVVERREIVHDTVRISIPHLEQQREVQCDSSILCNQFATSEARILPDGALHHTLATLPQQIVEPIALPVTLRDSVVYRERLVREVVEVERELTAWQRLAISGFYFLLLLLLSLILLSRTL
ncbi:MAG: hypothetical protein SNI45_02590 [Rikenellaceae bacterium]